MIGGKSGLFVLLLGAVCLEAVYGSVADRKCEEYSKIIRKIVFGQTYPADYPPNPQKPGLGKEFTFPGEFPHMAQLQFANDTKHRLICSGFLISDEYVLTSGLCGRLDGRRSVSSVRLGVYDKRTADNDPNVQEYRVVKIIMHPKYQPVSRYNDLALLKLERKVQFNKYVLPACLQTQTDLGIDQIIATGYGALESGGDISNQLLKVRMDVFTNEECRRHYPASKMINQGITDEFLCSGGRTEPRATCQGDSGGPVQIYRNKVPNVYSAVGVISFGRDCGIVGVPEVATRISYHVPWIESVVWP